MGFPSCEKDRKKKRRERNGRPMLPIISRMNYFGHKQASVFAQIPRRTRRIFKGRTKERRNVLGKDEDGGEMEED